MQIEAIHTDGLAHLSYLIVDGGVAAVVDPRLDTEVYLRLARQADARIRWVFDTHRNEDLVSGARTLTEQTGADCIHGTALDFGYGRGADHGETFDLGEVQLEVLHTPGHTLEHIAIALRHLQTGDDVVGVFTGDALFVGDVGRTDFYPDRPREVAGKLYDSIHDVLLPLGDSAIVWPAHGAGSVCGGGMAERDFSTIGYERRNNPRLQLDRDAFVEAKSDEEHPQPPYFRVMEQRNQQGWRSPGLPRPTPVSPAELCEAVIDVRSPEAFAGAHVPESLCLPASMIPAWAGWWLDHDTELSVVAEGPEQLDEALHHLLRLGYTSIRSTLQGGLPGWETAGRRVASIPAVDVVALAEALDGDAPPLVVDVRKDDEWEEAHIDGAVHVPLRQLRRRSEELPRDRRLITLCATGRRATIAASLLRRQGFEHVSVCPGSMQAWTARDLPTV